MFMENAVKIFVIESLEDGDRLTGTNLYNDLINYELPLTSRLYNKIIDGGDWYGTIEDIKENVQLGDVVFIHLEIHGNSRGSGIVLKDGTEILFDRVCEDFRVINKKIGCNLYVTLAVCHGLFLITGLVPLKEMPFCGVIGSQEEITVKDLELRFYEFYKAFLEFNDIEFAMEELQKANSGIPSSYKYVKPEEIFFNSWKNYMTNSIKEDWQKENAQKVADENHLNRQQRREFERKFKKEKNIYARKVYKEKAELFFMIKDFPENRNRFQVPAKVTDLSKKKTS